MLERRHGKKALWILALTSLARVTSAETMEPAETGTELENRYFLTLVGDSITRGTIEDRQLPDGVSADCWRDLCYAALLQTSLNDAFEAGEIPELEVVNVGIVGATSRDYDPNDHNEQDYHYQGNGLFGAEQGRPLFRNIPPSRIVVIYLGTNDAVGFFEPAGVVTAEEYEAHLLDIVRTLVRHKVKYLVLVTPPIPRVWQGTPEGELMREYRQAIVRICKRFGRNEELCFLDLQTRYPDSQWLEGVVHPTLAGHEFIAGEVSDHIERILRAKH